VQKNTIAVVDEHSKMNTIGQIIGIVYTQLRVWVLKLKVGGPNSKRENPKLPPSFTPNSNVLIEPFKLSVQSTFIPLRK